MDELSLGSIIAYRFKYYKENARKRKIEWALTREEFRQFILKSCSYCGAAPVEREFLVWGSNGSKKKLSIEKVNGIDRIDSSKGYVKDNCTTACETCNRMKLAHSVSDFIGHVKKILSFWGSR